MKQVIFVRHGETLSNVNMTVQGADDTLTDTGHQQASQLAGRLSGIEFDVLISSDYVRARETAEATSVITKKEIELSKLFREVKRPETMVGVLRASAEYQDFLSNQFDDTKLSVTKSPEAEYLSDVIARVIEAKKYIEERPERVLLIVTHGHFLRAFTAYILSNNTLNTAIYESVGDTLMMDNTGITSFIIDGDDWKLKTWNDLAHFAEQ